MINDRINTALVCSLNGTVQIYRNTGQQNIFFLKLIKGGKLWNRSTQPHCRYHQKLNRHVNINLHRERYISDTTEHKIPFIPVKSISSLIIRRYIILWLPCFYMSCNDDVRVLRGSNRKRSRRGRQSFRRLHDNHARVVRGHRIKALGYVKPEWRLNLGRKMGVK